MQGKLLTFAHPNDKCPAKEVNVLQIVLLCPTKSLTGVGNYDTARTALSGEQSFKFNNGYKNEASDTGLKI